MQGPWHRLEKESQDSVWMGKQCPVSVMGQIYSGMAGRVFAASVSCLSSLLGRPFLTEPRQLGRCCFRILL